MPRSECMNMNLKTISRAKEIVKGIRTQICTKGQISRDSYEAPKMRGFPKNQNGAQNGAQGRSCKRNTLSQGTLKQRICAVCAGRSEACPKDALDFEPTSSATPRLVDRQSKATKKG